MCLILLYTLELSKMGNFKLYFMTTKKDFFIWVIWVIHENVLTTEIREWWAEADSEIYKSP